MPSYKCSIANVFPCRHINVARKILAHAVLQEFTRAEIIGPSLFLHEIIIQELREGRTVGDYIIKYDGRKEICRTMPYSKIRPRSIHNSDTVLIPGSQLIQIWWIVHPEISSFALCKFFVGFRYSTRLFFYTVGMTVRCRITLCVHR